MSDETIEFKDVKCIKETAAALLCLIGDDEVWMPKSQVDDDSEVASEGDEGVLVITEWIAIQKGLL